LLGDANLDGLVNAADFLILASKFNQICSCCVSMPRNRLRLMMPFSADALAAFFQRMGYPLRVALDGNKLHDRVFGFGDDREI
jgi:hypothetical protein